MCDVACAVVAVAVDVGFGYTSHSIDYTCQPRVCFPSLLYAKTTVEYGLKERTCLWLMAMR